MQHIFLTRRSSIQIWPYFKGLQIRYFFISKEQFKPDCWKLNANRKQNLETTNDIGVGLSDLWLGIEAVLCYVVQFRMDLRKVNLMKFKYC
jgi:hypothetical protein